MTAVMGEMPGRLPQGSETVVSLQWERRFGGRLIDLGTQTLWTPHLGQSSTSLGQDDHIGPGARLPILQVGKLRLKAYHLPCAGSHGNHRKFSLSPGCWLKLPPLLHPRLCPDMHSCPWGLHRAGHSPCVAGLSDSISPSRRAWQAVLSAVSAFTCWPQPTPTPESSQYFLWVFSLV